jgi:hypothetical protein
MELGEPNKRPRRRTVSMRLDECLQFFFLDDGLCVLGVSYS